ncbi:MAG: glycosyltransferase [Oscillospiraceae bacterium]|nr:glycosyltransferase [Oscillospiraceae bacterium]
MKKELLFILPSLGGGGAEKSLVTLLSLLDDDKYSADLFLFRNEGLFRPLVPPGVHVFDAGRDYLMFDGSLKSALIYFLTRGKLRLALARISYALAVRKNDRAAMWRHMKKALPRLEKNYDAAIGYLEGISSYFCAENVTAKRKLLYVHNDYEKLGMDAGFDRPYFRNADCVVTVSSVCADTLRRVFPESADKIRVIENIVSPRMLRTRAVAEPGFTDGFCGARVLTVGRMSPQKGIARAVRACALLRRKEYRFRWYHIGRGELSDEITALISEENVADTFILLGEKSNPYPYMDQCDIYVQPSDFEGRAIAVDEAKRLCKPIVVTDFSTARDQIADGADGLIAGMDHASLAEKIGLLLDDAKLCERLSENLRGESAGNEPEIEKFYALIN